MIKFKILKIILILVLIYFAQAYLRYPYTPNLLDNVNLLIHEAGHLLTSPFGMLISVFGGTILQLLMPLLFVGYFLFKRQWYSSSITGFWLGQNLVNVSEYIKDAIYTKLPLFGGENVIHDWNYIFGHYNMFSQAMQIGQNVQAVAMAVFAISAIGGIVAALDIKLIKK